MIVIALSGVIGWDIIANDIREALDSLNGEEIEIQVSSPGGLVTEGLEIYNLIKNYPGKKTTKLMGLAASMASYIVLAGDKIIAEDNAVYMIHNARGIGIGDHITMRKTANILEGLSNLFARAYSKKSGKPIEEVKTMMDEETYLFGSEILDAGFVDEMEPAGDGPEAKDEAITAAALAMAECEKKLEEMDTEGALDKAAAMIGEIKIDKPVVDREQRPAATAEENIEEVETMNLDELKKAHPDVYAAAVEIGIKKEQDRRNAIAEMAASDPDNSALRAVCDEAIEMGTDSTGSALMTKVNVAIRDGQKLAGENPPAVETTENLGALSADDIKAAGLMQMSIDEYRQYMKEAE